MTVTYPIPMTFDEFVGPYKLAGGVYGKLHSARALQWLTDGRALVELPGGYFIHRVRYSVHPESNERQLQRHGPAVVCQIEGVTVGGAREHYVWVHPQHEKLDIHIASEMGIAWFKMTREDGTDWRLTPESRAKHGTDKLTPPGLAFRTMQYKLMVERGILDPGDSPVPPAP